MTPKLGNIWWLASYPKSGNTWVRMFLLAYLIGEKIDINATKQFVISDLDPKIHLEVNNEEQYFANYREKIKKLSDVCVKTHNANVSVEDSKLIPLNKTNGGVYIVRDPRDVVISLSKHYNIEIDKAIEFINDPTCVITSKVRHTGHILSTWSIHVNSWLKTCLTTFRYEDILKHTEEAFKKIIEVLYLPDLGSDRLKFAIKESSFDNLSQLENENGFIEYNGNNKFFRVGKAGQWRDILTKKQVTLIEKQQKEIMEVCGYL